MSVRIQPIHLERDFEICFQFRLDAFACSFGENAALWPQEVSRDEYYQFLKRKIQKDPHSAMHVWQDQQIIGQIEVGPRKDKPEYGYIHFFYLVPEMRGHGITEILENFVTKYFFQRGFTKAFLSVSPQNQRATSYYKKTGWLDQGPRPKLPEVRLMSKIFNKASWTSEFYKQAHEFLNLIFADLKKNSVNLENWPIDHLCYRTSTAEDYQATNVQMAMFAELLIESPVNGRMICTYKLHQPIWYLDQSIDVIEVPAPKPGKKTKSGFEHFEVVTTKSFANLQMLYGHLKLETGGLKKTLNPELEISFGERAIKFHHQSLEAVIEIEKSELKS